MSGGQRSPSPASDQPAAATLSSKPDHNVFKAAALSVLRQLRQPMTVKELTREVLGRGLGCPAGRVRHSFIIPLLFSSHSSCYLGDGISDQLCPCRHPSILWQRLCTWTCKMLIHLLTPQKRVRGPGCLDTLHLCLPSLGRFLKNMVCTAGKFGLHEWK